MINTGGQLEPRGVDVLTQLPNTLIFNYQRLDTKGQKQTKNGKTNNKRFPHQKKKSDGQSKEKPELIEDVFQVSRVSDSCQRRSRSEPNSPISVN